MTELSPRRTISGIPTMYNGVQFRSRLEAHWAAFFDLAGWRWDYEPLDYEGWIPDFLIRGHKRDLLVEVKPEDQWPATQAELEDIATPREILILGEGPFLTRSKCGMGDRLGLLRERFIDEPGGWWQDAAFGRCLDAWGFIADEGCYHDRISGYNDGPRTISDDSIDALAMWRAAANAVQWKAPKAKTAAEWRREQGDAYRALVKRSF